jgi:hypothetical protein
MPSKKRPPTSPRPARRRNRLYWIAAAIGALAIFGIGVLNHVLLGPSPTETPRPDRNGSAVGIPLVDGGTVGDSGFATAKAAAAGQGSPVDGISCEPREYATLHVHAHLALFVNGVQKAIPANIGIVNGPSGMACLYWLHTHDATGIIHVESPASNIFTLGQFFDIWGRPLERARVGSVNGVVHADVNGAAYSGDLRAIPLSAHQQITLDIGRPVAAPPHYLFPDGE